MQPEGGSPRAALTPLYVAFGKLPPGGSSRVTGRSRLARRVRESRRTGFDFQRGAQRYVLVASPTLEDAEVEEGRGAALLCGW